MKDCRRCSVHGGKDFSDKPTKPKLKPMGTIKKSYVQGKAVQFKQQRNVTF